MSREKKARLESKDDTVVDKSQNFFLTDQDKRNWSLEIHKVTQLPLDLARMIKDYHLIDEKIYSTVKAFAAHLADGSVMTWGYRTVHYGISQKIQKPRIANVRKIVAAKAAHLFVAIRCDDSIEIWGEYQTSHFEHQTLSLLTKLVSLHANLDNYLALLEDGSFLVWERKVFSTPYIETMHVSDMNVQQIKTCQGFNGITGLRLASGTFGIFECVVETKTKRFVKIYDDVKYIASTLTRFSLLLTNGNVCIVKGCDSSTDTFLIQARLTCIKSSATEFAGICDDGRVITWGEFAPDQDAEKYMVEGPDTHESLTEVCELYSNYWSFAVIYGKDRRVHAWASDDWDYGGSCLQVEDELHDILYIRPTHTTFAALRKTDGKVIEWGRGCYSEKPKTEIKHLYSTYGAFAAIDADCNLHVWGYKTDGADVGVIFAK